MLGTAAAFGKRNVIIRYYYTINRNIIYPCKLLKLFNAALDFITRKDPFAYKKFTDRKSQ